MSSCASLPKENHHVSQQPYGKKKRNSAEATDRKQSLPFANSTNHTKSFQRS